MSQFLLALGVFLVAHLVPAAPSIRSALVRRLGRTAYLVGYSAVSLALLDWVLNAAQNADVVTLWDPAPWQWLAAFALMPLATFFMVAGLLAPNPMSISLRRGDRVPEIARITRHPVLWGIHHLGCGPRAAKWPPGAGHPVRVDGAVLHGRLHAARPQGPHEAG